MDSFEQAPGVLESVAKHAVMVILIVLLAGGLGYAGSLLLPTVYEADAQVVLVDPETAAGLFADGRRAADPERRLLKETQRMTSRTVLEQAVALLGTSGDDARTALAGAVDVQGSSDGDIITISATAGTPETAVARANAVATAYEEVVGTQAQEDAAAAIAELDIARAPLEERLTELNDRLAANPDDASAAAQQRATLDELITLETRARQLAVNSSLFGSGIEYIEPALPPQEPSSPQPVRNAVLFAVLGLLAGAAVAWWREDSRDVVERPEDLGPVLNAPMLGQVPDMAPSRMRRLLRRADEPPLLSDGKDDGTRDEAYNFVATSLDFALAEHQAATVVFTSATPNEGKTLTTINTALAASGTNRRVVLVDADLRKRSLTRLVGLDLAYGLSDLVTLDRPLRLCMHSVHLGGYRIDVVPAGRPHQSGFFRLPQLRQALELLRDEADLVLIDSPAVLPVADAVALAGQVDAIVAVVSRDAHLSDVATLRDRLSLAETPLLGFVFNRANPKQTPYGYYAHAPDEEPRSSGRVRVGRRAR